jgi:hypothetical protein
MTGMRPARAALVCVWLAGCVAMNSERQLLPASEDSHGISLERLESRELHVEKYRVRNVSSSRLRYQHWAALGPEPVAYCRDADHLQYTCSRKVLVMDFQDSSGIPARQDTFLDPHESVTMEVNTEGAEMIGILMFTGDPARDSIVWFFN